MNTALDVLSSLWLPSPTITMMAEQKNIELSQGSAVDAGNHVSSKKKYILYLFIEKPQKMKTLFSRG